MSDMPNPLSRIVQPPQSASIEFEIDIASKQPELAALVGHGIGIWSMVDCMIGQILADMLGPKAWPAWAMYDSIESSKAKIKAVKAAAQAVLSAENNRLFRGLMRLHDPDAGQRHIFAHWLMARSEQKPGYLVLVKPSPMIKWHAALTAVMHGELTHDNRIPFPGAEGWYAYSKEELEGIVLRFNETLGLFSWFRLLVRSSSPEPAKLQALEHINKNSRLLAELARVDKEALKVAPSRSDDSS
jgi:hypothetical protein